MTDIKPRYDSDNEPRCSLPDCPSFVACRQEPYQPSGCRQPYGPHAGLCIPALLRDLKVTREKLERVRSFALFLNTIDTGSYENFAGAVRGTLDMIRDKLLELADTSDEARPVVKRECSECPLDNVGACADCKADHFGGSK